MPRNGSGTFTVDQPPFVPGTSISSTATNSNNSDFADGLTDSLARDGQGGMQGQFKASDGTVIAPGISFVSDPNTGIRRVGADSMAVVSGGADVITIATDEVSIAQTLTVSEAVNLAASVTVASAATTDLGAAASNNVTVSGTATITSFGTADAGITRDVTASGAFTLTHNGTSLILPGAANIIAVAGDTFSALSLGSGNWKVTRYDRASGKSVSGATPSVTVDNTVPRFDGTAGELQTSTVVIADDGSIVQTSTGTMGIPSGTTAQRTTPGVGFRYNTTLGLLEYFNGSWVSIGKYDWEFTSALTAVSAAGDSATAIAHGLGVLPAKVDVRLQCAITQAGYSVGDEITMNAMYYGNAGAIVGVAVDATNITIITRASVPTIAFKNGGNAVAVTPANWRWIARASR